MATNLTVLGAGDGTVTIPVTSAANAAVAQTMLAGISMAVASGALTQVDVNSTGGTPTPGATIGLIEQNAAGVLPPLVIGNNDATAVLAGAVPQAVVTGVSPGEIIVSGAAGAEVDNLGANTLVYFGGGDNQFVALGSPQLDLAPTAVVYLAGSGEFDLSFGATTVFASTGAAISVVNTGTAENTINLEADSTGSGLANALVLGGAALTAATVNAAGAGLSVTQAGGAALINANASNVTVFGGTGAVTLFGSTGTDLVSGGAGLFHAGSGGGSLLVGSSVPGAARLVGGGNADTLQGGGAGDVLVAGAGRESLLGGQAPVIMVGYRGSAGASTDMVGGGGGGNVFFVGEGATSIEGNHGDDGGNVYIELTSDPKTVVITDFVSSLDPSGGTVAGADAISLAMPGGGRYWLDESVAPGAALPADAANFSTLSIGSSTATELRFGDGATWTLLNCTLTAGDFR